MSTPPRRTLRRAAAIPAAAAVLLAVAACRPAVERAPPERPVSERPALDLARFENEIRAFEAADRTAMPDTGGVLFVGSSSMRLWPDVARDFPGVPVINRGFGGSTVAEVVNYARRIVVPYRPRLIVLYAGDNDLQMGLEPREVLTDYRRFVDVVRRELPRTRMAYVSVKPSPSRWALANAMRETNALIRAETERDSLQTFVDIFTPMLGANGRPRPELYVADSLHMTPAGYALWRERLAPVLR